MRRWLALAVLIVLLALIATAGPVAGQVAWTELARTEMSSSGWHATAGRWMRTSYDAYRGCLSADFCTYYPYYPTTGALGHWWTSAYDDSGWSTSAFSCNSPGAGCWQNAWGNSREPIPQIGRAAWRAYRDPALNAAHDANGVTDLHRRRFDLPPGYTVSGARIYVFSDNHSSWHLNGSFFLERNGPGSGYQLYDLPVGLLQTGSNLLAIQVSNDNICANCNPMGVQYLVEAQLSPTAPAVELGAPCAGGALRTVSWTTLPGFEYRVQAAQDAAFSQDVRTSNWTAAGSATFDGLTDGVWY